MPAFTPLAASDSLPYRGGRAGGRGNLPQRQQQRGGGQQGDGHHPGLYSGQGVTVWHGQYLGGGGGNAICLVFVW